MPEVEPRSLLDPAVVSRLGPLELIATRVVEGLVTGKHRSPYRGCSVEFVEHRGYSPGDEIRLIDWRAYARRDRYYIKQFEQQTNLRVMLVADASGSMGFGLSTVTKFRYAQMAAACMAYMMLQQGDAVGLATVGAGLDAYIPPRSRPGHLRGLLDVLASTQPAGDASLAAQLHQLARRLNKRGMLMVLSDCFDDVDALLNALHHLRSRGHEVLLLHIMAPEELSLNFDRWTRFEDLENAGRRLDLDAPAIRAQYLERVRAFLDSLRHGCGEMHAEYWPFSTAQPLADLLSYYVGRRAARMK